MDFKWRQQFPEGSGNERRSTYYLWLQSHSPKSQHGDRFPASSCLPLRITYPTSEVTRRPHLPLLSLSPQGCAQEGRFPVTVGRLGIRLVARRAKVGALPPWWGPVRVFSAELSLVNHAN